MQVQLCVCFSFCVCALGHFVPCWTGVAVNNHPVDEQQLRTVCVVRLGLVVDFGRTFCVELFLYSYTVASHSLALYN